MKSILLSIRPEWCEKILSGKKTIEVRKSAPKEVPFKVLIYATKKERLLCMFRKGEYTFSDDHSAGKFNENIFVKDKYDWQGKVIGEFICDRIDKFVVGSVYSDDIQKQACLSYKELVNYFYNGNPDNTVRVGYAWHISDLKIYDKPKYLNEFTPFCKYKGERCEWCSHYVEAFGGCCKTIKRPPQSYMFVEVDKE